LANSGGGSNLKYLSLGSEIAVGLSAPIIAGYWLDTYTGTSPLFLLLGIALGITIMIYMLVRLSSDLDNKDENH
jgi:F0F1-type ATP synthase assembly protein I